MMAGLSTPASTAVTASISRARIRRPCYWTTTEETEATDVMTVSSSLVKLSSAGRGVSSPRAYSSLDQDTVYTDSSTITSPRPKLRQHNSLADANVTSGLPSQELIAARRSYPRPVTSSSAPETPQGGVRRLTSGSDRKNRAKFVNARVTIRTHCREPHISRSRTPINGLPRKDPRTPKLTPESKTDSPLVNTMESKSVSLASSTLSTHGYSMDRCVEWINSLPDRFSGLSNVLSTPDASPGYGCEGTAT